MEGPVRLAPSERLADGPFRACGMFLRGTPRRADGDSAERVTLVLRRSREGMSALRRDGLAASIAPWSWPALACDKRPLITARAPISVFRCAKRPFFTQGSPVGPLTEPPPVPRVREWEDVRQGCLQARPGLPSREHAESMKAPSRQALRGSGAKGRLRLPGTFPRGGPGRAVWIVDVTYSCAWQGRPPLRQGGRGRPVRRR